jgi:ComF family protein
MHRLLEKHPSRHVPLRCMRSKDRRIVPPFCETCSEPFEGSMTSAFTCANCAHRTIYFDAAVAAYRGRGIVREIIHEFKYARQIHLRHLVAHWLRAALDDERLRDISFDLIVPVPLHPARQRERGFNQASLLAELLSAQTSMPSRPVLQRIRYTTTQTALDRSERMENLHNAFRLRKNADVRGLRVLLIDDVLTTGSTLSECARVLKRAGAISVHAATAARA